MRLTVPANYDPDVVPALARYPVEEVYGKFPVDIVGGGRPSYMGTPLSRSELREYVALLARHGIAFNYLLNSACQSNREWTRGFQKRLMRLLDRLADWGVQRVTVVTPYLLELVKARFPGMLVKVGIYAQVDTVLRARFWEDLGADAITLESFSINRDFLRLAAIRNAVRCDLQLIANHPCLPNCPLQAYHMNGIAHASDGSRNVFVDYCFLRCSRMRLEEPSLLIKAGWIRPEDIGAYEAVGYSTFKLIERGMPSGELVRRVRAYAERRFEGNLAELVLPYGWGQPVRQERFWLWRYFIRPWQLNPLRGRTLLELIKSQGMLYPREAQPIRIEAGAIPADFLRPFRYRDCAESDCRECGHCHRIAEQAVRIDPAFREESLGRYRQVERSLADGSMWGM